MNPGLAYSQTRLQIRLSARPTEPQWQLIEAANDLAQCLEAVTRTSLSAAVAALNRTSTSHDIERALRDAWADRVEEVSTWIPSRLRPALLWLRPLPHLRFAETRQSGISVPSWVMGDRVFGGLWQLPETSRLPWEIERLKNGSAEDADIAAVWRAEFEARLPRSAMAKDLGLEIDQILDRFLGLGSDRNAGPGQMDEDMIDRSKALVRRRSHTVAALVAALCIVALDLGRLRGALLLHAAFSPLAALAEPV